METVKALWSTVRDFFIKIALTVATFFVNLWHKVKKFCVGFGKGFVRFFVNFIPTIIKFAKGTVAFVKETFYTFKNYKKLSPKQRAAYWDKVTTGILVLVFCLPVAILAYILLWFVLK